MSVRIVKDFWANYEQNKPLIERCFNHLYNSFPHYGGKDESFNNVMVRLFEYGIFERFDTNKVATILLPGILMKKEGISKEEAELRTGEIVGSKTLTMEDLEAYGINADKKWEHLIYNWIKKVIYDEYRINGKYTRTHRHGEGLIDFGTPKDENCPWMTDDEEIAAYKANPANFKEEDRRGKLYPPSFSNRMQPSEGEFDNQLDAFEACELRDLIISKFDNDNIRKVFSLVEAGFSEVEIAEQMGLSKSWVNIQTKKIKAITSRLCLA